jgi:hypothetical protein
MDISMATSFDEATKTTLFPFVTAILDGIAPTIDEFIERVDRFLDDFGDAFPNPLRMVNVTLEFVTGIPGFLVAVPFNGFAANARDFTNAAGYKHRLMTSENAISVPFEIAESLAKGVTFTTEDGIIEWLAQRLGTFLWTLYKRLKFVLDLIDAFPEFEDVLDVIQFVKGVLKGTLKLNIIVAAIALILAFFAFAAANVISVGLIIFVYSGRFEELLLPQDSQRVGGTRKGQHRLNLRKGTDR